LRNRYGESMSWRVGFLIAVACALSTIHLGFALADPSAPVGTTSSSRAGIEHAIRDCANHNRIARGLPRLLPSSVLTEAARFHAQNMARLGFFAHLDPSGRGAAERVRIFDTEGRFTFVGENIGAGYGSAHQACVGWMHSPGHRENILRSGFTYVGGGYAHGGPYGSYYVQVFAKRIEPREPLPEPEEPIPFHRRPLTHSAESSGLSPDMPD
jgi:uncharacterized protein YkwD